MTRAPDRPQPTALRPPTPPSAPVFRPPPPPSARRLDSPAPPAARAPDRPLAPALRPASSLRPRVPSAASSLHPTPRPPGSARRLLPPPDASTARLRPASSLHPPPDARCLECDTEAAKKRQARTADEEEYECVVLVANTNRDDSIIEARSVEDAIAKMAIVAEPALPSDRHPERRLKVSYKAFEEAELARLKEEKPSLTLHQYKDMIWKLWKKSPDNPLNQVAD